MDIRDFIFRAHNVSPKGKKIGWYYVEKIDDFYYVYSYKTTLITVLSATSSEEAVEYVQKI